ncbi:MAG: sugar phosphate isomerase/epimerase family protein [Bryobacteraceae bacterium]
MLLGAVTYNVLKDWDVETIIRNLQAAGFEAVELRTGHKHLVEPSIGAAERERVKNLFERSKVRLLSFGSTCEFQSPDAAERERQIQIARTFIDLAHDTGAWAVKVRPNGLPKTAEPIDTVVGRIADGLRELGDAGAGKGVEIWMEVHGNVTQNPPVAAAIMRATRHEMVGLCWNSNPTDVVNGSVRKSWELLRPWVKNAHINELSNDYPWRELFTLMTKSGYDRYTLCEAAESKEPERFLGYYKALWTELTRA